MANLARKVVTFVVFKVPVARQPGCGMLEEFHLLPALLLHSQMLDPAIQGTAQHTDLLRNGHITNHDPDWLIMSWSRQLNKRPGKDPPYTHATSYMFCSSTQNRHGRDYEIAPVLGG